MNHLRINKDIEIFSRKIRDKASREAEWHPIDRFFIEPYLSDILNMDPVVFTFTNFELGSQLWAVNLFLCLPEVWMKLEVDDLVLMVESFTTSFSFYSLMEFTYKYLQVDILKIVLNSKNVKAKFERDLKEYLELQWNILVMTDNERDFLENDVKGEYLKYNPMQWNYVKQKFLLDNRVEAAVYHNMGDFKNYIFSLIR